MQASRASTRALRALTTLTTPQTRALHMTGSTTFSSLLTTDKPVGAHPHAKSPRLPSATSFPPAPDTTDTGKPVRHFNTSRSLKAVNDSSTIDFAYLPDFDPDAGVAPAQLRVPVLPWGGAVSAANLGEEVEVISPPTIHTVSASGAQIHAPAALHELADSSGVDFQGMAAQVARSLGRDVDEGVGMARQIWRDLVEDVVGKREGK